MKHYLFRIYTEDDEELEILVGADTKTEAEYILAQDETINMFSYLDKLTEEEAENSGLDEL